MSEEAQLCGHAAPWQAWCAAIASGRLHHGWILAGPQGLGKGHFARAAAAALVKEGASFAPSWDRHPDILLLEPLPATEGEETKRAEGKPYQTRRNITIDQVRRMQQRLTTRPTLGNRRAIIIDPADDLERSAVNALLKSLEEPPAGSVFLLVSHRPGRLMATVRSRCRMLRFAPCGDDEIAEILAREVPEADAPTRIAAIAAAQGSPGAAIGFVTADLGQAHGLMLAILRDGDATLALRGKLTEAIGAKPDRPRLAAILELASAVIAREVSGAEPRRQLRMIDAHEALARLTVQAPSYNFDPGLVSMEIGGLLASVANPREA